MAELLWQPTEAQIRATNMYRFMEVVNERFNTSFDNYNDLHQWSVEHLADFWATVWDFVQIQASTPFEQVIDDPGRMPGAQWFQGAELNFAQNLLRYRDDRIALILRNEDRVRRTVTYAELYGQVARLARSLRRAGVGPGDRVVGFVPNMPESIMAMLAATSLGAVWSSCSPDFGIKGVLDRFGQIKPKALFTADGYFFKGKPFDSLARITEILKELPAIETVVVIPFVSDAPDIAAVPHAIHYNDFMDSDTGDEIPFAQLPFSHPLYIMYSSGTTGLPKCMVQSAGGVLINQLKELVLHTDLKREDHIFYFTTCGWMMWNWLTASLATGATLILFDGNPFYPDAGALWQMAQDEKISVFGTSAGYLTALQNSGLEPRKKYDLSSLRALLSTGSPLTREGFAFVYAQIKSDIQLASISGGSDLNGCFALGNPMGPVYSGELQCRGLGMKVFAFDDNARPVVNQQGELVCAAPFPSMPIYFWEDPEGKRYHNAYFDRFPGVWAHGDYIEVNDRGGVVIYGRSDATLNPGGVRIGTAEIYRQVEQFDEIEDSLVIGQQWKNDVRVILFLKMAPQAELTDDLLDRIKTAIRVNTSPRHIPAKILTTPDIPYTLNMKKVELAVKKVIEGKTVLNKDALRNPEILDYFANLKALQEN
jgi:acetoacetyl-CoA synthetase